MIWPDDYVNKIICGDCLEVMNGIPDGAVDCVITDPPYGCDKAEWDVGFPVEWYQQARRVATTIVTITGSSGLKDSVKLVGEDFIDVIAAWNKNSLTRGPLGFNNWLAAVISKNKPKHKNDQNIIRFSVCGKMPNHPSPKPIQYMLKLLEKTSNETDIILDPFCGSGTTCVAAKQMGRKYIGIEISPEYAAIAQRRVDNCGHQLEVF